MADELRDVSIVAKATLVSRVLGLLRDVLVFAVLGVGAINSAFILGFTVPNLFRRLLGEGALTSAIIPVMSEFRELEGSDGGFSLLNRVLSWLICVLVGLCGVGMLLLWGLHGVEGLGERWHLGIELTGILLPYMIFICLAAILVAALNVHGKFFVPALGPVFLNLAMIAGLGAAWLFEQESLLNRVYWLCGGVLVGGGLQLVTPFLAYRKEGWRFCWDFELSRDVKEVVRLLIPGLAGAAIFQVNILVSRLIAFQLDENAAGVLYLGSRLVELPLGIFAVAIATVYFPKMAQSASKKDGKAFMEQYTDAFMQIIAITVPASVGLILLREPILEVLFAWGRFSYADVLLTMGPLFWFALGIPFYGCSTLGVRGLHSWKEMKAPIKLGAVNGLLNLVLSLLLMKPMGAEGLALANVFSAAIHAYLLDRKLKQQSLIIGFGGVEWSRLFVVGLGAISMGVFVYLAMLGCDLIWGMDRSKGLDILLLCLVIPSGVAVYLGVLHRCHSKDAHLLLSMITRQRVGQKKD